MQNARILRRFPFLFAAPAVLIGCIVMTLQGLPAAIALQNAAVLLLGGLVSALCLRAKKRPGKAALYSLMAASLLSLCAVFLFPGAAGVHRWIDVGPFALHAALIALPVLLIGLYAISKNGQHNAVSALCVFVSVLLFLQKDASMLTAFLFSVLPLMRTSRADKSARLVVMGCLPILTLLSWIYHPLLEPAAHVEGILGSALACSPILFVLGVLAMGMLFCPFGLCARQKARDPFLPGCALFYAGWLLSCLSGAFPIPVMGYGASAVIGYLILAAAAAGRV